MEWEGLWFGGAEEDGLAGLNGEGEDGGNSRQQGGKEVTHGVAEKRAQG